MSFFQIAQCARSPQFEQTVISNEQASCSFSDLKRWQGVATASKETPVTVMDFLLSVEQFDLAAEWAEIHDLPKHFHKVREKIKGLYQKMPFSEEDCLRNA